MGNCLFFSQGNTNPDTGVCPVAFTQCMLHPKDWGQHRRQAEELD